MANKHTTVINAVEQRGHYYLDETNDCTVRALANVVDPQSILAYARAHDAFDKVGRRSRRGTRYNQWTPVYTSHGLNIVKTYGTRGERYHHAISRDVAGAQVDGVDNGMTVARFIRENPKGKHILVVRRHAMAVVDGVVYDSHETSGGTHVFVSFTQGAEPVQAPSKPKFDKKAYMKAYNARKKAAKEAA